MTTSHRALHAQAWTIMGPLLGVLLVLALVKRPPRTDEPGEIRAARTPSTQPEAAP